jgi:hypothetical protein
MDSLPFKVLAIISKSHFISYPCLSFSNSFNSNSLFFIKRLSNNNTRLLTNITAGITPTPTTPQLKQIKKIAAHKNPKLNPENRMTIYVGPLSPHVRKYKRLALLFSTCGFLLVPSIYFYGKAPIVGATGGKFHLT